MSLIHEVSDLFKERKGSTSIHPTWKVIELRKVCEIQNGFAFQSSEFNSSEGVPLIRIRDILKHNPETYYRGAYSDSYIVEKGDLLVGMDGDFNHSLWKGPDALLNQRVCRIIPNQEILLTRFLYYGLGDYLKKINENTSSTTVKHLSSKSIGEIPFALPPLPEQQRIVAKLDLVFGHLDRVQEKLDRIPELLKNFRQQVLTQAVTGELTREWREGKDLGEWDYVDLQKIAEVVDPHPSHRTPPSEIDGVPYISIKDVDSRGLIDFQNATLVSPKILEEHVKRYTLKEGDLGFGKIGTLGKPFRLPIFKERTYTLSANIILIQPKSNCNPKFLFYYLDSPIINKLLKEGAKATSQPAFGIKKARIFPTPNPSQEEQEEIVKRVDVLFDLADKIESQYQSLKTKIDQMPQAILAKAFRGELVEQEVKEYVREIGELGMVAEEVTNFEVSKTSKV